MELILGEVFPIEHVDLPASHDSLLECTYASTHYIISVEPTGNRDPYNDSVYYHPPLTVY